MPFPNPVAGTPEPDWLAALYRASELYVLASVDEAAEGLSLAMLEGMAARLPVVATSISGNRDIIRDGVNGMLVAPARAISWRSASYTCSV